MNDDLPEIFQQLQPPAAPPHLRSRVLAAVNGELTKRRKPRWERVLELSVAASLVLGVGLNVSEFFARPSFSADAQFPAASSYASSPMNLDASRERYVQEFLLTHRADDRGALGERYFKFLAQLAERPAS